jgi:hypothetical protein
MGRLLILEGIKPTQRSARHGHTWCHCKRSRNVSPVEPRSSSARRVECRKSIGARGHGTHRWQRLNLLTCGLLGVCTQFYITVQATQNLLRHAVVRRSLRAVTAGRKLIFRDADTGNTMFAIEMLLKYKDAMLTPMEIDAKPPYSTRYSGLRYCLIVHQFLPDVCNLKDREEGAVLDR